MPKSVNQARKEFGRETRQIRKDLGMIQSEFAKAIHCTQTKVSQIENGKTGVNDLDARNIARAAKFAAGEEDRLVHLASQTGSGQRQDEWGGARSLIPENFRRVYSREPYAAEILAVHGDRLSGILQSYHRSLSQHNASSSLTSDDINAYLNNRSERGRVLKQTNPPECHFILSESALRRVPGEAAIGRDQIQHLLWMEDQHPTLWIYIVPYDAVIPDFPTDFTILRFGEPDASVAPDRPRVGRTPRLDCAEDFVHVEQPVQAVDLDKPEQVQKHLQKWDITFGYAMQGRDENRSFLLEVLDDFSS